MVFPVFRIGLTGTLETYLYAAFFFIPPDAFCTPARINVILHIFPFLDRPILTQRLAPAAGNAILINSE
jgi:hypothetical protein